MDKKLIDYAIKAMENTYSPYSNFPVGAAILMKDDNIIVGCNVENASFGATNCAERTAIFSAVAMGYKKEDFVSIAIVSKLSRPIPPCGICRQVMLEFFKESCIVYMSSENYETKSVTIGELVPFNFTQTDLEELNV